MTKYLLRMIVDSRPGVMARIGTLLSRKGYNIKSICVGKHIEDGNASINLTIKGEEDEIMQAKEQLGKLIDVIKIDAFHESDIVEKEHVLVKIKNANGVGDKIREMGGTIVSEGEEIVFEFLNHPSKIKDLINKVLNDFEVIDISRSGTNAI